jgi:hypothetical protein
MVLKGKTATALVCLLVGTTGSWAAYSYAVPAIPLLLSSANYERAKLLDEPQTTNTDAKGDRLPIATMAQRYEAALPEPVPAPAAFSLAAATATPFEFPKPRIEPRIEPQIELRTEPKAEAEPRAEQREPQQRKPAAPPKRAEPPQRLLLDDSQIAALRARLKLTPTQEEFWPAVEVSLRNVVRQHARKARKHERGAPPPIDVNSPEVQQLISAAVPLIMRMSEAQKREVRQLARIIGLDTVASRI